VKARGINLGTVEPEEDIKKIERRHAAEAKQLTKPDKKKKAKKAS
jgi:hypothetical protein